jgi:putative membrane protein
MSIVGIFASSGGRRINASFLAGMLVLAALWLGPLPSFSQRAFSPHMMLHLGIVVVAAPLIAFGLAVNIIPPMTDFVTALRRCLFALLFEMVAVWSWHVPLLHDAAARNSSLFVLEQVSFLVAGLAVWTAAFTARSRETAPAAAVALFLTFTHMTMFGLILSLAPLLLYDPNLCRGALGLNRLQDQHLGGVLMAVGGGLPYLIGTGWAVSNMLANKIAYSDAGK